MLVQVSADRLDMVGQVGSAFADQFKPPRFTVAGRCLYCETPECSSAECVALHEASTWGVCEDCAGRCCSGCVFGVIELDPADAVERAVDVRRVGLDAAVAKVRRDAATERARRRAVARGRLRARRVTAVA